MVKAPKGFYFLCPYCQEEYTNLGDRNNHVLHDHSDRIVVTYGDEGKWICWMDRDDRKLRTTIYKG